MGALLLLIVVALAFGIGLLCWASFERGYQRGWDERSRVAVSARTVKRMFEQGNVIDVEGRE